ncbi:hypothetical protein [Salinibacter altiplanensis]|uniref:hypothetical protein n=1 Tax=Salinibacter altiplanensis TaxID=1803181 RepID=UPI0012FFDCD0|nr:hypothetical protein [Salinibacter altiplanensis]
MPDIGDRVHFKMPFDDTERAGTVQAVRDSGILKIKGDDGIRYLRHPKGLTNHV